jgi:hypothetical protein
MPLLDRYGTQWFPIPDRQTRPERACDTNPQVLPWLRFRCIASDA